MDNTNDIIELLDFLYGMITEAWGVPLGNDKCVIEREKALDIINDIKAALPNSIAESKRLVSARDEFIGNAKREAESLRKNAEGQAAKLVDEQEVVRIAKERSMQMIADAEKKSSELKRVASEYVDEMMRKAEESLNEALTNIRQTQVAFRSSSENSSGVQTQTAAKPRTARTRVDEEEDAPLSGDIPLDF